MQVTIKLTEDAAIASRAFYVTCDLDKGTAVITNSSGDSVGWSACFSEPREAELHFTTIARRERDLDAGAFMVEAARKYLHRYASGQQCKEVPAFAATVLSF